eukprot:jgi/Pico_ML_1/54878/g734.t1
MSVMRSSRTLEETFAVGAAVLASMSDQRDRIKHAQRKALDVLHSVGLSDSLLRLIERKQTMDKIIVYGGMALLLFVIAILWYWTRHKSASSMIGSFSLNPPTASKSAFLQKSA